MTKLVYVNGSLALALLTAACGSAPLPADRMASAEAGIRSASEMGAPKDPQAALYLKLAQEELEKAKNLIKDGDNERADSILMRSESDAELSLALAKEVTSRAEAQQVLDQVKAVQSSK